MWLPESCNYNMWLGLYFYWTALPGVTVPQWEVWIFLSPSGQAGEGWPQMNRANLDFCIGRSLTSSQPVWGGEASASFPVWLSFPNLWRRKQRVQNKMTSNRGGVGRGLDAEEHQASRFDLSLNSILTTSWLCRSWCCLTPVSSCAGENSSPGALLISWGCGEDKLQDSMESTQ